MSAQAWELLVRRLELKAKKNAKAYRVRVAALAALGYVYLGVILAAVVGGAIGSLVLVVTGHPIAVKLLIVLGILAFVIVRALPVKLDPPEGVELSREDAPELFALVDRLRAAVAAPSIHHVLVDGQLNAFVTQVPRFGWFGPTRNYLVVGLPLLAALSDEEFTAVVAHELGHVSGGHGRFGAWIYRLRRTWDQLLTRLEEGGHWGIGLFRRFFRWYAPYFNAYSFVLVREQEYEADRASAAAAGADAASAALARLELVGSYLDETYWPGVYRGVESSPAPQARPVEALARWLSSSAPTEALVAFRDSALERRTDTAATHPSLTDRLAALGVSPAEALDRAVGRTSPSAASRFLGASFAPLVARLDDEWREGIREWWRAAHDEANEAKTRFAELERAGAHELDSEALAEKASLTHRFEGRDAALPVYHAALKRDPSDPVANYVVAQALLAEGNDEGLRHLDRAMLVAPESVLAGCELAESYLEQRGRSDDAERYRAKRFERLDELERADEERRTLRRDAEVCEHDRSAQETAELGNQLGAYPAVERAFLAKQAHAHLDAEFPSYVLLVEIEVRSWKLHMNDPKVETVRRLAAQLEAPFEFFVVEGGDAGKLARRVRKLRGAQIYTRS